MSEAAAGVPRSVEYAGVAVPVPVRRLFTYRVPEGMRESLGPGVRVVAPLGSRKVEATVVAYPERPPEPGINVKPLAGLVAGAPPVSPELLALTSFVADYYLCSWGDAIEAALPPRPTSARAARFLRPTALAGEYTPAPRATAQRQLIERLEAEAELAWAGLEPAMRRAAGLLIRRGVAEVIERDLALEEPAAGRPEPAPRPTPAQRQVLDELQPFLSSRAFSPFLLFGATGSGKTEVYLRAAEQVLAAGRSVLYLVPEIGLTPLLVAKISRRFPGQVAVLHSGLAPRERFRYWAAARDGRCPFVVGARSAIFAPLSDIGLIVVDEEQDHSYKQEETPRYNGRDLAVVRARQERAVVLMGSATPSMESYHHARSGRYKYLDLGGRIDDRPLAAVECVDMRQEYGKSAEIVAVSGRLLEALRARLERGEQALVLRNRRGWAVALHCPRCGERVQCSRCSISLTWHRRARRLRCHYCGEEQRYPEACPTCGEEELRELGEGTERVEDALLKGLPGARIERMDRDTIRRRGAHEELLRRFASGGVDILVGTQMIAKGHDFPRVTLVGVLSADQALGLPDFRAGERAFQLLTQVAGRAGRGERPGEVIVQAFDPDNPVLALAARQDFAAFYEREIVYRRALRYPPLSAMVRILVQDQDELRAREWASAVTVALRSSEPGRLLISGPGPAPVERIKGRFRQQILVRSAGRRRMVEAVGAAMAATEKVVPRKALVVDVDPQSLL